MSHTLVPLDGSTFAEAALPLAIRLARETGSSLTFLSVLEAEWVRAGSWSAATLKAELHEYLEGVVRKTSELTTAQLAVSVLDGSVAAILERFVESEDVGLVVMSTHGRGAVHRAWLGSIADHLIRHLRVPIVLVRPVDPVPERLEEAPALRVILVPLDGSQRAEEILQLVGRLARPAGTECRLFRVVPPPPPFATPYLPHAARALRETLDRGREEAEQYLQEVTERLRESGLTVSWKVEVGVRPATGILHAAEAPDVDLVAIATHGRGGIPRLMLGSVADKVVRGADLPVLVARI
jgi:nucleotide-binding universal stress UspA family protein